MAKFTEEERNEIYEKFLAVGGKLFIEKGLNGTTIDNLVDGVGVAKGTFYSFFDSKEHLYMLLLSTFQRELFKGVDLYLEKNKNIPPRDLTKEVVKWMLTESERYPLIIQSDAEVMNSLSSKLSKEIIEEHIIEDEEVLMKLKNYEVEFICGFRIATKVIQLLTVNYMGLIKNEEEDREEIFNIMLDGAINEMVGE